MAATPNKKVSKRVYVGSHFVSKAMASAQGQSLIPTITQELCGSDRLAACTVVMQGGKASKAHLHEHNDIIVIVVEGHAATLIGEAMEPVYHGQGEFLFIPAGVPHAALNLSPKNRVVAFEIRTDPLFNADVVLLADLEPKLAAQADYIHKNFHAGKLPVPNHWDITDVGPFKFAEVNSASW